MGGFEGASVVSSKISVEPSLHPTAFSMSAADISLFTDCFV